MPDIRPVLFILGFLLIALGLVMLPSAAVDGWHGRPDAQVFLASSALTCFAGGLCIAITRQNRIKLRLREAFLLTNAAWMILPLFAAIPFVVGANDMNLADSVFEAISGLTTTGSTVISALAEAPPGLLLWRSMLQWIGGIGIIVMGIAILPFLEVGGMQLFRLESSDRSEKVVPRARSLILSILGVYLLLTVLCVSAYALLGMGWFDAINHAMTTVSTGGFSTYDSSFGHFQSSAIIWTAVLFMLLGATTFPLLIQLLRRDPAPLLSDAQVRTMLGLLAGATAACVLWRLAREPGLDIATAITDAAFNLTSVVTTTGFANTDYQAWGGLPVLLFFLLTFVGGCSGSTSGGFKMFRLIVLVRTGWLSLAKLVQPNAVLFARYQGQPISDQLTAAVLGFAALWAGSWLFIAVALSAAGLDLVSSLTGAATALANVGLGLGGTIGPAGNFATVPDAAKWVLSAGMLLGRLEMMTLLVLLLPNFWRG